MLVYVVADNVSEELEFRLLRELSTFDTSASSACVRRKCCGRDGARAGGPAFGPGSREATSPSRTPTQFSARTAERRVVVVKGVVLKLPACGAAVESAPQ